MARSRLIKTGLAENEVLAELGPHAQLLFALLPCHADREGRLEDRPKRIKAKVFPYYDADVDALLDQLANCSERFIVRYEVSGERYIQISNFAVHQRPHHKEEESEIPGQNDQQAMDKSCMDQACPIDESSTGRAPNKLKNTLKNKSKGGVGGGKRFCPPTVEEVATYVAEKQYRFDPEMFVAHYQARGWVLNNGRKMACWKSACTTFEKNHDKFAGPGAAGNRNGFDPSDPRGTLAAGLEFLQNGD